MLHWIWFVSNSWNQYPKFHEHWIYQTWQICQRNNTYQRHHIIKCIPLHNIWSPNIPQISVSQIYAKSQNIWHLIVKYTQYLIVHHTCQNNWIARRARGTTERSSPEKEKTSWMHYFVTFHLFHLRLEVILPENMPTLDFANHDILCFLSGIIASLKAGFA